jgi:hypothetical protein
MTKHEALQIAMSDLREALRRVLDAVEEKYGTSIDLDADYYWSLRPAEAFDLTRDPGLETGQISDDVGTVQEILSPDRDVYIWHDLEHVCGILTRLSALDSPLDAHEMGQPEL